MDGIDELTETRIDSSRDITNHRINVSQSLPGGMSVTPTISHAARLITGQSILEKELEALNEIEEMEE